MIVTFEFIMAASENLSDSWIVKSFNNALELCLELENPLLWEEKIISNAYTYLNFGFLTPNLIKVTRLTNSL